MKVYIITNIEFPYGMAPANRIRCYARALALAGVDCEVLIYRRTERYGQEPQNTMAEGECEGVRFTYTTGTPLRGSNVFVRKIHDYFDRIGLIKTLRAELHPGDVLFLYDCFDVRFDIILAKTAHRCGCKIAVELCELPYGTVQETQRTQKKRKIVTNRLYPNIDGILAISDALVEFSAQYVRPECKIEKIPILVDFKKYALEDQSADEVVPFVFHSGSLFEQKDGILGMVEAFGMVANRVEKPIKMICTGSKEKSPHCKEINELIEKYSLQNRLVFTGYLDESQLREYLKRASIVVINKKRTQQNRYCFSTKLGEYMAAGKLVIITNVGEAMNWLSCGKDAIIIEPESVDGLAEAIACALEKPDMSRKIGATARETCRNSFDYPVYSTSLSRFFYSL